MPSNSACSSVTVFIIFSYSHSYCKSQKLCNWQAWSSRDLGLSLETQFWKSWSWSWSQTLKSGSWCGHWSPGSWSVSVLVSNTEVWVLVWGLEASAWSYSRDSILTAAELNARN